jgi:mycothione reductase
VKRYDVIVIGSGSGGEIVDAALSHGFSIAWIDKGPLGGTCLNVGCITSKMIIYPADRIVEIQESEKLGIKVEIKEIDFNLIMNHMRKPIKESHEFMEEGLKTPIKNFDYYKGEGCFVSDYILEINGKKIHGKKIFIGSGARPLIPLIRGLDKVDYLTNDTVFNIKEKPKSMTIIGGGYISVEFAHFFSAIGTKVTILQRGDRLIPNSEPEISNLLKKQMEKRMDIILNVEVNEVKKDNETFIVIAKDNINKKDIKVISEKILIATGRKSNADLLKVVNTGVDLNIRGYIKVNEFLETSKKNIWAFGDAIGKYMFKHVANQEAILAWQNALHENKIPMDYSAIPYAVFTHPQISGVGLTEEEAKNKFDILVGKAKYNEVSKGEAMM